MSKLLTIICITILSLHANPLEQINKDAALLKNKSFLQNFYEKNQNQPLWLVNGKIRGDKVSRLLRYILGDSTINSRGYLYQEAQKIKTNLTHKHTYESIQQLELRLTTLYYEYLQHLAYGEIDWVSFEAHLANLKAANMGGSWVRYPLKFDIIAMMSQENIGVTIQQLKPKQYGYDKLLTALSQLNSVKWKGGWGVLPPSKTLRVGSRGAIVQQLRQRLALSGDYQDFTPTSSIFDQGLANAVKRFQRRHGLKADGVVGAGTKKYLNISVEEKIRKVLLNLDRMKWLPRQSSERYIVVNIPEYKLHYMYYQDELKSLNVVVGKPTHPTPVFSDKLSYITLNPYWKVPESIVAKEVVPAMLQNPNYIRNQGLEAHETWEENSTLVSLQNINWQDYLDPANKFPYRLMQPPSPRNALGKIKFKFPNNFAVYLHDTPSKHLFSKKRRAYSHGCVRLQHPTQLLEILAEDHYSIDLPLAKRILRGKKKEELHLDNKVPINIVYLTTWVNANNELTYGDDIYGYDNYQVRKIR